MRVTRDGFDASDQTQVNTGNCDYNNGTNRQLKVSLYADPGTGCAPVNGVNLRALVTNAGISGYNGNYNDNSNGQLTYSFDCDNNGTFEKTITSADSEIIVSNLCSYSTAGIYTARVRVDLRGQWATDTAIIKANNCGYPYLSPVIQPNNIQPITPIYNQPGAGISVQKMVANLSNGSAYQSAVTAAPGDFVSFKIVISSASGGSDLTVSDIIPAGITNVRDVRLDGQPIDGSIASGINIGNLYPNQQRIVIFTATIGAASSFPYGQTTLTDIATARNSSMSNSSTAVIYVLRQTVLGATNVSTGILGAEWVNYLIAGILALIAAAWLCKDSLISVYRALKSYKNTLIGKA